MFIPDEDFMKLAIDITQKEMPRASGYRLIIKKIPIPEQQEGDKQLAPELASRRFIFQDEKSRQAASLGSDRGIVCDVGPHAYSGQHLGKHKPWVKEADIVIFARYTGHNIQIPMGTKNDYTVANDEDIFGKYNDAYAGEYFYKKLMSAYEAHKKELIDFKETMSRDDIYRSYQREGNFVEWLSKLIKTECYILINRFLEKVDWDDTPIFVLSDVRHLLFPISNYVTDNNQKNLSI